MDWESESEVIQVTVIFCLVGFVRQPQKNPLSVMLSTVARCARQIRWPSSCYQKISLRAQNLTKNPQKRDTYTRKYSQLPERNVVGVRNESSKSTDGQNELLTWARY